MLIGDVITISFSGIYSLIEYAFGTELANTGQYQAGELFGVVMFISEFIALIGGILELVVGIIGAGLNRSADQNSY